MGETSYKHWFCYWVSTPSRRKSCLLESLEPTIENPRPRPKYNISFFKWLHKPKNVSACPRSWWASLFLDSRNAKTRVTFFSAAAYCCKGAALSGIKHFLLVFKK